MSERELFECEFPKPKDIYWCEDLNDYNYIDKGRGNPYAYDNLISYRLAWKAWKTSANRQGYKLVPVEMSLQKKIDDARKEINNFFDNQTMIPTAREYANKLADVLEILK